MAVVRGLAGLEWLIAELQTDKANMCDMALPFSKNSIKGTELDKISEFKSFIIDDTATEK